MTTRPQRRVAVLSDELWRGRYAADRRVLGRTDSDQRSAVRDHRSCSRALSRNARPSAQHAAVDSVICRGLVGKRIGAAGHIVARAPPASRCWTARARYDGRTRVSRAGHDCVEAGRSASTSAGDTPRRRLRSRMGRAADLRWQRGRRCHSPPRHDSSGAGRARAGRGVYQPGQPRPGARRRTAG